MSFLASFCTQQMSAAWMMPMMHSTARNWLSSTPPTGAVGSAMRYTPYVPSLSSVPARMTEPAVGAWSCARGSQVCTGKNGTFTANPTISRMNTQYCCVADSCVEANSASVARSKLHVPPFAIACCAAT